MYFLLRILGIKLLIKLIRILLVEITTIVSTKSQTPSRNYYCFVLLSRLLALMQKQQQSIAIGIYCFVIFHLITDCTPFSTSTKSLLLVFVP
jgi:hypothetical protein